MRAGDAVGLEALAAVAGWARTGGSGREFRIDFGAGAAEVRRYCAKLEARMTLRLLRRCCPVLRAAGLGNLSPVVKGEWGATASKFRYGLCCATMVVSCNEANRLEPFGPKDVLNWRNSAHVFYQR